MKALFTFTLTILCGLVLFAVGCGEPESTGHKDDPTPGGTPTPPMEETEMGKEYEKQQSRPGK